MHKTGANISYQSLNFFSSSLFFQHYTKTCDLTKKFTMSYYCLFCKTKIISFVLKYEKASLSIQQKWRVRLISMTSLDSVSSRINVKEGTSVQNWKILMTAKISRAAKKDTLKSAKSMPLQVTDLKNVLPTNTKSHPQTKIMNC